MNTHQNSIQHSRVSLQIGYGLGDFGLNFYWQGASFFLLFFYTDLIGLPNSAAGAAYAVGGIFDALADPIMGYYADHHKSRWGKYRPFLLYGAAPLGLTFFLLFALPIIVPTTSIFLATVLGAILFRLSYTFVSIPYNSLGIRISYKSRERTRIAGIRMLFGAIAGVLVVGGISLLLQYSDGVAPFLWAAALFGFLGALFLLLCFLLTKELPAPGGEKLSPTHISPLETLSRLYSNKPFMILVSAIFFITMANMFLTTTTIYRFEYILKAPNWGHLTLVMMAALPVLTIPLWTWVYFRFDKKPAFIGGCIFSLLGFIALVLTGGTHSLGAFVSYSIAIIGFSSFAVGFWSMLPDTVDYGHMRTGDRIEARVIGIGSAIQKGGIALAGLLVGILLDIVGYRAGEENTSNTLENLHIYTTLIPLIFMAIAMVIMLKYPISRIAHHEVIATLKKRHQSDDSHSL